MKKIKVNIFKYENRKIASIKKYVLKVMNNKKWAFQANLRLNIFISQIKLQH